MPKVEEAMLTVSLVSLQKKLRLSSSTMGRSSLELEIRNPQPLSSQPI